MHKQFWIHALISLLGAIGLPALSAGLDRFLPARRERAVASMEFFGTAQTRASGPARFW